MKDSCNVVASIDCEVPPGSGATIRTCFRCGLPVCGACSKIVIYRKHRTRFCGNCIDEAIRFVETNVTEIGGAPLSPLFGVKP